MKKIINVPNILTISRIVALPFFAFGFFWRSKFGIYLSLCVFLASCVTDFLDGYYARAYKQATKLGRILDPMADKVLTSVAILFIVGFNFTSIFALIPASVVLCREIIISGVRDAATFSGKGFKTSRLAKWKTAFQMISIALLMYSKAIDSKVLSVIGESLFWFSAFIAVISGFIYFKRYCSKI